VDQSTLDSYATSVATGRSSVNAALSALTSAQTAQKNAAAALDNAQKTLALKKAGPVQADIDAQAAVVAAAQADVQNAQAQLSKTRITAPFTGVVTNVDAEVGKIVSPTAPMSVLRRTSSPSIPPRRSRAAFRPTRRRCSSRRPTSASVRA
jgi:multidrug resistance efflux pump